MPSWATAGERCGLLWLTSIQRMTWSSAWRQVRMHERAGDAATSEGVGRRFWRANRRRSVRILLRARPGCCRLAPFLACSQFLRAGATRRGRGAGCSSGSGARRRCAGTARRATARSCESLMNRMNNSNEIEFARIGSRLSLGASREPHAELFAATPARSYPCPQLPRWASQTLTRAGLGAHAHAPPLLADSPAGHLTPPRGGGPAHDRRDRLQPWRAQRHEPQPRRRAAREGLCPRLRRPRKVRLAGRRPAPAHRGHLSRRHSGVPRGVRVGDRAPQRDHRARAARQL